MWVDASWTLKRRERERERESKKERTKEREVTRKRERERERGVMCSWLHSVGIVAQRKTLNDTKHWALVCLPQYNAAA